MKKLLLFSIIALLACWRVDAQTTVIIGANDGANTTTSYPSPLQDYYKAQRAQYLFTAAELTAAGLISGSSINEVGWVTNATAISGHLQENYSIYLKNTTLGSLVLTVWETGVTQVYGPTNYSYPSGYAGNVMFTTTPFSWDGTSNLLVEVCGGLTTGGYTLNPACQWDLAVGFNGSHTFRSDAPAGGAGCGEASVTNTGTATTRPRLVLTYGNPPTCFVPTGVNMTSVTESTAQINWTNPGTGSPVNYEWEVRSSGAAGSGGAGLADAGTVAHPTNFDAGVNGLTPGTTYSAYVRTYCGGSDYSSWTGGITFLTGCSPYSSSPNLTIPTFGVVSNTITTSGTAPQIIGDLDVKIQLTHTWVADMEITLTSPGGTSVIIWDNLCGSNDNMTVIYDDEGAALICGSPTSGTYMPSFPLSAFDSEGFDGIWTLTINDQVGGDGGVLQQWCLLPTLTTPCDPDLDAVAITSPSGNGYYGASVPITIDIKNNGLNPQSFFDVFYQIDGGPIETEMVALTLNGGQTTSFTFTQTADLSAGGAHTIFASTAAAGDCNAGNDAAPLVTVITIAPNDNCINAINLTESTHGFFSTLNCVTVIGNNTGCSLEAGELIPGCGLGWDNTLWYRFTAPTCGGFNIKVTTDHSGTTINANRDSEIALYRSPNGTCDFSQFVSIQCDDDGGNFGCTNTGSGIFASTILRTDLMDGAVYYIQADGWGTALQGQMELSVETTPDAPALTAGGLPTTQIQTNWTGVVANHYDLYWKPTGGGGYASQTGLGTNSYLIQNLLPGTSYDVQVKNVCIPNGVEKYYSPVSTLSTVASACASPGTPTCGTITNTSIQINWTNVPAAVHYRIFWRKVGQMGYATVNNVPAGTTSWTFNGLLSGTSYEFWVRAVCEPNNPNGNVTGPHGFCTTTGSPRLGQVEDKNTDYEYNFNGVTYHNWDPSDLNLDALFEGFDNANVEIVNGELQVIGSGTAIEDVMSLNVYPNPASTSATVAIELVSAGEVIISVYDVQGKLVKSVVVNAESSTLNYTLSLDEMPSGMYNVVVETGTEVQSTKLAVVK